MAVILRYFSEFGSFLGALRNSSRSLSHLLMSSCRALVKQLTDELSTGSASRSPSAIVKLLLVSNKSTT